MRFIKAGLSLAVLLPCLTQAATWVEYDAASAEEMHYYDKDSVKIQKFANGGSYIKVQEKIEFTTRQRAPVSRKVYHFLKTTSYYDCQNNRYTFGGAYAYHNNGTMVEQAQVDINTASSVSWDEIDPDTVVEGRLQEICQTYRHRLK